MKNITFINAGAGSGKTFSLTEELYRNINNGICRGDQVLLTTFTKKAAKEIKDRAYTKLLETGKIEDAILLQNAYIGTVHSVGYHLIKKFCYLIGLSPNIKELSEGDTDFYFSQAISAIPSVEDLDKLALLSEQFDFQKSGSIIKEFDPNKWKDHVRTIISEARRNNIEDLTEGGLSFVNSLGFINTVFEIIQPIASTTVTVCIPAAKVPVGEGAAKVLATTLVPTVPVGPVVVTCIGVAPTVRVPVKAAIEFEHVG